MEVAPPSKYERIASLLRGPPQRLNAERRPCAHIPHPHRQMHELPSRQQGPTSPRLLPCESKRSKPSVMECTIEARVFYRCDDSLALKEHITS
eukprot:scaffold204223_cov33-Tisochrysis_lutea.AAC.1